MARYWGHEVEWTLGGQSPANTERFEPIFNGEDIDFTSDEDARARKNVTQPGVIQKGARITMMVPKGDEAADPVLDQLTAAVAAGPDARVGPLEVASPVPCAMTIPSCSVRREPWAPERNGKLTVVFVLMESDGAPTPPEP